MDFLLDWDGEQVAFFKDGKFQDRFDFYHGVDRKAAGKSEKPVYKGVDTLMLYTLSNGAKSSFADIHICQDRCLKNDVTLTGVATTL